MKAVKSDIWVRRACLWVPILTAAVLFAPLLWVRAWAEWDVAHGIYHLTEYGPVPINCAVYETLLVQRYGVHVQEMGCIVSNSYEYQQTETYNDIVRDAVKRKYHRDIFAECAAATLPHR